jgi:hypothetical protein
MTIEVSKTEKQRKNSLKDRIEYPKIIGQLQRE